MSVSCRVLEQDDSELDLRVRQDVLREAGNEIMLIDAKADVHEISNLKRNWMERIFFDFPDRRDLEIFPECQLTDFGVLE
ncbi:hypothetical protein AGABI1DRAFT_86952 [Agaricus bisporus var. burnettii JB137-S8]|uniref:Uncharacterized protein n=1 Tax=Agaricus bisporus var. burnettii (strain JB137-S8 / ATCC MYA-4627 / FGSC 10392) TaxID=597362 RepID=K5VR10_AGABU|nr:uncharacterized protein AGABI1DRAFT_86952 [Agaricus bisporus var. burnettii JB137-S8]EKM76909.1 hypothetical protein AGABI1DRAFT_86952 [Agaricus bisporus var. burnettii JB137-S8]